MSPQSVEHFPHRGSVTGWVLGEDEDVVEVDHIGDVNQPDQGLVDVCLEGRGCV